MKIGVVENFIRDDVIVFWLYQLRRGRWEKVSTQKVPVRDRMIYLNKILMKAEVIPLGRGS